VLFGVRVVAMDACKRAALADASPSAVQVCPTSTAGVRLPKTLSRHISAFDILAERGAHLEQDVRHGLDR
jgi:hypothetical protein